MAERKIIHAEKKIVRAFDKARANGYRYTYQTFRKVFIRNVVSK